jgi:uncharacterized iron-regulated membrane protein
MNALYSRLHRHVGIIILFMAALSGVLFFFSSRLQHVITRPIFHLAQTAKIGSGKRIIPCAQK